MRTKCTMGMNIQKLSTIRRSQQAMISGCIHDTLTVRLHINVSWYIPRGTSRHQNGGDLWMDLGRIPSPACRNKLRKDHPFPKYQKRLKIKLKSNYGRLNLTFELSCGRIIFQKFRNSLFMPEGWMMRKYSTFTQLYPAVRIAGDK